MEASGVVRKDEWNPEILENRALMLIPFTFDAESMLDRNAIGRLNCFVDELKEMPVSSITTGAGVLFPNMGVPLKPSLWEDLSLAVEDFFPFMRQIASASRDGISGVGSRGAFAHPVKLAEEFLISQIKGGKPRRFRLLLGKAAKERCGRNFVTLQFHAPTLYGFATGTAILVLEWEYLSQGKDAPLCALEVLEGNYAISHRDRSNKTTIGHENDNDGETALTSNDLLVFAAAVLPKRIADGIMQEQSDSKRNRRILYTGLRVGTRSDQTRDIDLSLLARRLSRRETTDYHPIPEQLMAGQLRPFANVLHAAAIEGGCTVVEADEKAPEFLRRIISDRVRNTYLPLAIVSFHAHCWLVNQTQDLPNSVMTANIDKEKKRLESLQERVLNFRRFYHFPIASQITQHNEFHLMWQETLQINNQLDPLVELSSSVSAMVQEKRLKLIGIISAGLGGFFIGKEIVEAIRNKGLMNAYEWQSNLLSALMNHDNVALAEIHATVQLAEKWEWGVVIGGIVGLVVGILLARHYGLKGRIE